MAAQQGQQPGYGGAALLAAAGGGLAAGLALGYALTSKRGRRHPPAKPSLNGIKPTNNMPAATPRGQLREQGTHDGAVSLVLLVRSDLALSRAELAQQAARTVLAIFKKAYKGHNPNLRVWEEGGSHIKVLGINSQNDMLLQQAAARALQLPTHTFASDRITKQRSCMALGPAPADMLEQITGHLRELAS